MMATTSDWITRAKAHGWGDLLSVSLDAFAPLAPLGAQLLWTAQPALSLFVRRDTLTALAQALEEPETLDALRRQLDEAPPDPS